MYTYLIIVCLNNSLYCIGSPKTPKTNLVSGLTSSTERLNLSQKEILSKSTNDRQFGLNSMANTSGMMLFTEIQDLFYIAYFK